MKYRVIFKGQATNDAEIDRIVHQLAPALKIDPNKIRYLFSGKTYIILKDADLQSCQKLKAAFETAGAKCQIEPEPHAIDNQIQNLASEQREPRPPPLPKSKKKRREHPHPNAGSRSEHDEQLLENLYALPDPEPPGAKSKANLKDAQDLIVKLFRKYSEALIDAENISTRRREFINKIATYLFTIGEGVVELIVNLAVMIMVERTYDPRGLGIYAYLLSLFFIASHLSEFGLTRFAEHEIAAHPDQPSVQQRILSESHHGILGLSLIFAAMLFLTAGWSTDHTRIGERLAAYLIIGATLPLRNLNRLKLSALHGFGRHEAAAKLKMVKRLIFFGTVSLLLLFHIPPSFLLIAFLVSEIFLKLAAARKHKLPKIKISWKRIFPGRDTLSQGYRFLFTDETLDILLYLDFFILGLFVSSWKLGVYAQAAILVRFLLLVPVSLKPVFRRQYCQLTARQASELLNRATKFMFYLQAVLTLFILLHFPDILNLIFHTRGGELLSFRVFAVFAPGLIFFAAFASQEAVYEAGEQVSDLKKIVLIVTVVDTSLNIYLVPFAGVFGAAAATMISMLVYFLIFDRFLAESQRISKAPYLFAGAGVYLLYALMTVVKFSPVIDFFLIPLGLFVMLLVMGYFHIEPRKTLEELNGSIR